MNPTDPNPLLPCPFCAAPARNEDGDHVISHDLQCFFSHQYAQEMWVLGRRKKLWNTRAPSAELTRTTESVEIGSKSVVAAPSQTPRTDALKNRILLAVSLYAKGTIYADDMAVSVTQSLHEYAAIETKLTQAQAEAAAMRDALENALRFGTNLPECDKKAGRKALSSTAGKDLLEQLRQLSAEREHNANEALAMRAERDEAIAIVGDIVAALELAQAWLCNSAPVVEMEGPKPLPVINAAITRAAKAMKGEKP